MSAQHDNSRQPTGNQGLINIAFWMHMQ